MYIGKYFLAASSPSFYHQKDLNFGSQKPFSPLLKNVQDLEVLQKQLLSAIESREQEHVSVSSPPKDFWTVDEGGI